MKRFLTLLLIFGASLAFLFWLGVYFSTPVFQPKKSFTVTSGERVDSIVLRLKEEGFIRSIWFFKFALHNSGLATQLQPGVYHFFTSGTYQEMIKIMTSGFMGADEFSLRIIEGWNLRDIKDALTTLGYKDSKNFYTLSGMPAVDGRKIKNGGPKIFLMSLLC